MNRHTLDVKKRITVLVMSLSVFSIVLMAFILSWASTRTPTDLSKIEEVHEIIEGEDALAEYIIDEKGAEPHFVAISNLAREDQRDAIEDTFLFVLIPVLLLSGGVGWAVSRYILRPVNESIASQERFIQDAAHELRNPLAAMSIAISNHEPKKKDNFTKVIERQTKRLIAITEDLLFLEKRRSGESIETVNISDLSHDVVEDMTLVAKQQSVEIKTTIDENIQRKINSNDYVVLLKNILENAIKYSGQDSVVKVSLSRVKGGIELVVSDKGIGISKEDLPKVTERFFRAQNGAAEDGTGLGLSIVGKVVNLYSLGLDIDSTLDKGTTVTITL